MPDSVEIAPPPLETAEHTVLIREVGYLEKTLPLPAISWVLYDLANTVYVATLTFIFVPYLADLFGSRGIVGIVSSISMVCAGMLVPLFAAAGDRTGRCRTYLIVSTLACIIPMALFGASTQMIPLMLAFFIANLAYNGSLVFYNALLPSVAADRNQGLISGLGVGLGYIGTLVTLVIVLPLQDRIGAQNTFYLTATLFLVFALPSFVFVKEKRVLVSERFSVKLVKSSFGAVIRTLKSLPKNKPVMWFLLGNFFCVDVLNTAILFFGDLTSTTFAPAIAAGEAKIFGFTIESSTGLLMLAGITLNGLALVFGVTLGFLTDRLGSLRVLRFSAVCLVFGLLGAAFAAGETVLGYLVGICGFGGLGLSGIWTAGRKLLIELSPREKVGEYFGLYGITTKLSVIGSAVVGILKDQISAYTGSDMIGWKVAIGAQAAPLLLGILFLALVKKPLDGQRRNYEDERREDEDYLRAEYLRTSEEERERERAKWQEEEESSDSGEMILEAFLELGLSPAASLEDVRKAHQRLALQFHPDRTSELPPSEKEFCTSRFLRIQQAYEALKAYFAR